MTAEEMREYVRASRTSQGLPATIADPATIQKVVALVSGGRK